MHYIEFVSVFTASFLVALLLAVTRDLHGRWTSDFQDSGVQKHHAGNPPRVGLLPLVAGAAILLPWLPATTLTVRGESMAMLSLLLVCAAPAAVMGLLEDVTKRVSPAWRLLAPLIGSIMAIWLLGAVIPSVGIALLEPLFAWWPLAALLTVLMVMGFTHAMNLVDGLNGLSSGLAVLMLAATAYAAHAVGDLPLMNVCLVLMCTVLGFMVLNFPRGLMFLGDGGAYFLGFVLALVWVLLLVRNPGDIAPWFTMAVSFHPTMETVFSILRRKLRRRRRAATAPDRLHMHTLVLRRRLRPALGHLARTQPWIPNAGASVHVLFWAAMPIGAALLYVDSNAWNGAVWLACAGLYVLRFWGLVKFRRLLPKWLRAQPARPRLSGPSMLDAR